MANLFKTVYGAAWEEKNVESMKDAIAADCKEMNAKVSNCMVTLSQMKRNNDDGTVTEIKDRNGFPVITKSICLSLVSATETNADGTPKKLGQTYLPLSKKSTLEQGDNVKLDSIRKITVEQFGKGAREYYDGDKE